MPALRLVVHRVLCHRPLYLLFIISCEFGQDDSAARAAALPSAGSSVLSFPVRVVSWWCWTRKSLELSLAFCRLWSPQGWKAHLSALSSLSLEQVLAEPNMQLQDLEQKENEDCVQKLLRISRWRPLSLKPELALWGQGLVLLPRLLLPMMPALF